MGRRLPLVEVSYPVGLSFLLHGLMAMAVVFAPQWLRAKPFKLPVTYEVTLVAPPGGGGQPPSGPSAPSGPKVAAAQAKTSPPPRHAAQPREVLTLPSAPRPVMPQVAVRSLPPPARTEEMTRSADSRPCRIDSFSDGRRGEARPRHHSARRTDCSPHCRGAPIVGGRQARACAQRCTSTARGSRQPADGDRPSGCRSS